MVLTLLLQFGQVTFTELGECDATDSADIDWGCSNSTMVAPGFEPT